VTAAWSALLALGAAALWAGGTVLGRLVSGRLTPHQLTVLRYFFGFLGATAIVVVTGAPLTVRWVTYWAWCYSRSCRACWR